MPLIVIRIPPVIISQRIGWDYFNGLVKFRDGLSKISLFFINIAAVVIGLDKFRVYFNGFIIIRQGLGKLALFKIGKAAIVIRPCFTGGFSNRIIP